MVYNCPNYSTLELSDSLGGGQSVTTDEKDRGKIIVIDPLKSDQVVYRGKDYEEVCHWLSEDEYEQVEGRMFPDDGW